MSASLSFRDPAGCCARLGDRILRVVRREAAGSFARFLDSPIGRRAVDEGRLIESRRLDGGEEREARERLAAAWPDLAVDGQDVLYEHPRVPFVSYPCEWPAEMLHAAAVSTLDLADRLLAGGWGLKDATPANLLFRGPNPVWIDPLSVESRAPGDSLWLPYAQFCRTFLFPLLMWRIWGLNPAPFALLNRDGIEPETLYRLCGWGRRLRSPILTHVTLPVWLGRSSRSETAAARPPRPCDPEQARFVLRGLFASLRRALAQAAPPADSRTTWTEYMATHRYSEAGFAAKDALVRGWLDEIRPRAVLDVGANTGHFSLLAARTGARVVAVDFDSAFMGRLWRQAAAAGADLLPLVVNLARPTPAVGWRNGEDAAFLTRAEGAFDTVLMLALVHHLLVTERAPLPELAALAARLTTAWALVEYVPPDDPMFRRIARGREALHAGLTDAVFAAAFGRWFEIARRAPVPDTGRILFLFRKKEQA